MLIRGCLYSVAPFLNLKVPDLGQRSGKALGECVNQLKRLWRYYVERITCPGKQTKGFLLENSISSFIGVLGCFICITRGIYISLLCRTILWGRFHH